VTKIMLVNYVYLNYQPIMFDLCTMYKDIGFIDDHCAIKTREPSSDRSFVGCTLAVK
jgi:hypothetical protein